MVQPVPVSVEDPVDRAKSFITSYMALEDGASVKIHAARNDLGDPGLIIQLGLESHGFSLQEADKLADCLEDGANFIGVERMESFVQLADGLRQCVEMIQNTGVKHLGRLN